TPSATPTASATPSATASASATPKGSASAATAKLGAPAATKISGSHFAVAASTPGCAFEKECTVALKLDASGGYHINKEYPYKFTANANPNVDFLGKDVAGENVFSKAAGDFTENGEATATLVVRFKAKAHGTAAVAGTYKMSVCSAENCQIETPTI